MDSAQWPQEIVVKPIEEIITNTCPPKPSSNNNNNNNSIERKLTRPQKDHQQQQQALKNCPRCNSTNTKFCYYNNYSLTQPRYFCKTCRRYWTEGGSLRNIPVGGGSRKNKRSSSSSSSSSSLISSSTNITNSCSNSSPSSNNNHKIMMMTKLPDLVNPNNNNKIMMINQGQDLNLGFSTTTTTTTSAHDHFRNISDLVNLPNIDQNNNNNVSKDNNNISALELLTGFTSRGFNSFMPMPVVVPGHHHHNPNVTVPGFSLPHHHHHHHHHQEFKPSLDFSLDGYGAQFQESSGNNNGTTSNGRLLFPFEDLKQVSAGSNGIDQNNNKEQGDHSTTTGGYWTGMLGGGSW